MLADMALASGFYELLSARQHGMSSRYPAYCAYNYRGAFYFVFGISYWHGRD